MSGRPAAALLLSCLLAGGASPTGAEVVLRPIPEPPLAGMEEAVAGQLADARAELAALEARVGLPAGHLAEAYGGLGQLYLAYDFVAAAEACLANARALAPGDFRWPYYLGATYQNERRLDEAREALEAALARRPDDLPARLRLGQVELAADRPEAAAAAFARALALAPGSVAALAGLGKAAAARGEPAAAAEHLSAALAAEPAADSLHYPLALAYRELGRLDDARHHLALRGQGEARFADPLVEGLLPLTAGAGVHLMLGNRALRRGEVDLALGEYRRALAANPESAPVHQALGSLLLRGGDEAGLGHLERALELAPDNVPLHYNLGTLLLARGDAARAAERFRAAIERAPGYIDARFNLATALARLGRWQEAADEYGALLDREPDDSEARFRRAAALEHLGRSEEAAAELATVLAGQPDHGAARRRLARLAGAAGRYAEAAGHYRELVAADPDDEEARFGEATALLLAGRDAEARERLEEGVARLPASLALRHALARLLAASADPAVRDGARALELARAVLRQRPAPDHAETVAMALAELGRYAEAVRFQERLLAELERAGGAPLAGVRARLAAYRRGEPCRDPWRQDGDSRPRSKEPDASPGN